MKTGFFTMEDVKAIEKLPLDEAKRHALNCIAAQPNARPDNVKKATVAVNACGSVTTLMLTMSNFVLAHPSEGLKNI